MAESTLATKELLPGCWCVVKVLDRNESYWTGDKLTYYLGLAEAYESKSAAIRAMKQISGNGRSVDT